MISVMCELVKKKTKGTLRVFVKPFSDKRCKTAKVIPKNAMYYTRNSYTPRVASGCGADRIENHVYWDKNLNPILNVRIEDNMTWYWIADVPKNVITMHKNELIKWLTKR